MKFSSFLYANFACFITIFYLNSEIKVIIFKTEILMTSEGRRGHEYVTIATQKRVTSQSVGIVTIRSPGYRNSIT